ncbi:bifunctional hydroxymethylpyrimidine kinase/phosphomethylpyrimidine kinase [Dehalobacterium formicoaceticum]|uniref:Hydroxymethylpyrimidine/phosphomethylpyrimidine kinase n=1 Tax=Dehalobacterium formicoaceticum TaxID=51515 RepID=A0ABT1Y2P5_9FIRM|nr:bifunctional hydroxymethylpyrimidine kinase/phosphomethylpyrimidine kinase [Dehalobacterium formicoaceticum]MCR6544224.1 bifunctional hydroxymethylpyrimidine kinase/phosphomethylpyrimidine kinase [Dehalobacterium formicoaceticum]
MKKVLTIAGSDCSGGAGIQADIKTMTAHKIYAMSVITALTAQNTTGVYGVLDVAPDFVGQQIDCVMTDIFPDAVKIGMVSAPSIILKIVDKLKEYQAQNIVVDPVMISTSGSRLLSDDAMEALMTQLIPLALIITPNIPEAECLADMKIHSKEEMVRAAQKIGESYSGHILIKGGHLKDSADDLLYHQGELTWFPGRKIANENTHGTGCTLSSAIACNLAEGYGVLESVHMAKDYIICALEAKLNLGQGSGPLNHCCW